MSRETAATRGLYFEEFEEGLQITTPGRTITEADIVNFAGLSGDYNSIHTDDVYASSSPAEQRVAHGMLILSIASGLGTRTGFLEGTVIYWREVNEWKFIKPVFIGDTVHVVIEVIGTKAMPRIGGGSVVLKLEVKNQSNDAVMRGTWTLLVHSRPEVSD